MGPHRVGFGVNGILLLHVLKSKGSSTNLHFILFIMNIVPTRTEGVMGAQVTLSFQELLVLSTLTVDLAKTLSGLDATRNKRDIATINNAIAFFSKLTVSNQTIEEAKRALFDSRIEITSL